MLWVCFNIGERAYWFITGGMGSFSHTACDDSHDANLDIERL